MLIDRKNRVEMIDNTIQLSMRRQCKLLSLHRGNYYYKSRGESPVNLYLMKLIDQQYQRAPFYGVPRMTGYLNDFVGGHINSKRVERLYKLMDIRAIGPNPNTSHGDKGSYKYPYLLRGLRVEKPNQAWAADITFIVMKYGYMNLFAIIDLYSRCIVNWGLSNTMHADWCSAIIEEALMTYDAPEIFNTDQGSQFTAQVYIDLLHEHGIQISMDGKGRAIDNIFIERFWRTIKYEHVYLNPANSGNELYDDIEEYMRFYNFERPHSSLDNKSPGEVYYGRKINFNPTKYLPTLV